MKVFILMRQSWWSDFHGRFTDPPVIVAVFADKKDAKIQASLKNRNAKSNRYYIKTKELEGAEKCS